MEPLLEGEGDGGPLVDGEGAFEADLDEAFQQSQLRVFTGPGVDAVPFGVDACGEERVGDVEARLPRPGRC